METIAHLFGHGLLVDARADEGIWVWKIKVQIQPETVQSRPYYLRQEIVTSWRSASCSASLPRATLALMTGGAISLQYVILDLPRALPRSVLPRLLKRYSKPL